MRHKGISILCLGVVMGFLAIVWQMDNHHPQSCVLTGSELLDLPLEELMNVKIVSNVQPGQDPCPKLPS